VPRAQYGACGRHSGRVGEESGALRGLGGGPVAVRHALRDRPPEQPGTGRRGGEERGRGRARGLAEHGDGGRIATERRDIVLHPAERRQLIVQARLSGTPGR
jgi:hypothetical protein